MSINLDDLATTLTRKLGLLKTFEAVENPGENDPSFKPYHDNLATTGRNPNTIKELHFMDQPEALQKILLDPYFTENVHYLSQREVPDITDPKIKEEMSNTIEFPRLIYPILKDLYRQVSETIVERIGHIQAVLNRWYDNASKHNGLESMNSITENKQNILNSLKEILRIPLG